MFCFSLWLHFRGQEVVSETFAGGAVVEGVGGGRGGELAVRVVQGAVGPGRGQLGAGLGTAPLTRPHRLGLVRPEGRRYKSEHCAKI